VKAWSGVENLALVLILYPLPNCLSSDYWPSAFSDLNLRTVYCERINMVSKPIRVA